MREELVMLTYVSYHNNKSLCDGNEICLCEYRITVSRHNSRSNIQKHAVKHVQIVRHALQLTWKSNTAHRVNKMESDTVQPLKKGEVVTRYYRCNIDIRYEYHSTCTFFYFAHNSGRDYDLWYQQIYMRVATNDKIPLRRALTLQNDNSEYLFN